MRLKILRAFLILPALVFPAAHPSHAQSDAESAKIQYLIKSIEELKDVKFLRNGNEYDSAKAAEHLRLKLAKAGSRVKTVEDFIRLCSKSYISGKEYKLRYPNGTTITAESYFRQRLQRYK